MTFEVVVGKPELAGPGASKARLNRRKEVVVASNVESWYSEDRVFQQSVGSLSTPVTGGGAGTVLDADQPEAIIDVPDGQVLRLISVRVDVQVGVSTADADETEIVLAIDRTAISGVTATNGVVEIPIGGRTSVASGSAMQFVSAVTTNLAGAPTLSVELAHPVIHAVVGDATSYAHPRLELDYEPSVPDYVVGPATVVLYFGGTIAALGFAHFKWAEFTKLELGL